MGTWGGTTSGAGTSASHGGPCRVRIFVPERTHSAARPCERAAARVSPPTRPSSRSSGAAVKGSVQPRLRIRASSSRALSSAAAWKGLKGGTILYAGGIEAVRYAWRLPALWSSAAAATLPRSRGRAWGRAPNQLHTQPNRTRNRKAPRSGAQRVPCRTAHPLAADADGARVHGLLPLLPLQRELVARRRAAALLIPRLPDRNHRVLVNRGQVMGPERGRGKGGRGVRAQQARPCSGAG